jgi:hypothetical protein
VDWKNHFGGSQKWVFCMVVGRRVCVRQRMRVGCCCKMDIDRVVVSTRYEH